MLIYLTALFFFAFSSVNSQLWMQRPPDFPATSSQRVPQCNAGARGRVAWVRVCFIVFPECHIHNGMKDVLLGQTGEGGNRNGWSARFSPCTERRVTTREQRFATMLSLHPDLAFLHPQRHVVAAACSRFRSVRMIRGSSCSSDRKKPM